MAKKKSVALVVFGVLGVLLLGAGVALLYIFDSMIHSEVTDNLPLRNGSDSFKNWQSPKTPILFQIWIFNVINHEEVIQGEKPYVQQHGPYTYREHREKVNITYFDNGTMNYRELRSFVFDREASVGSEDDTFNVVNLPALAIMDMTKRESLSIKKIINDVLKVLGENLFIPLSVKELMWGYEDNLLKEILKLAEKYHFNLTLSDEFGLFYNQNNTDDGLYNIYSGIKSVDNFGKIVSWNYLKQLNYWTSDISNMINGTDGTIYSPFIDRKETKYLFSSDLCRSLGMDFVKDVTVKDIDLARFVAPDIMFGNVTVNPYNAGFCTPSDTCLPSGLLNVSTCRSGAPVIMSMPHFLGCDPETINSIEGMHPVREEHQSYIDIEPTDSPVSLKNWAVDAGMNGFGSESFSSIVAWLRANLWSDTTAVFSAFWSPVPQEHSRMTGVAMNVGKRLQINTYINKIDGYTDLANIKAPIFMPVLWLNESAVISDNDAEQFRSQVLDEITLTTGVKFGLIALGGFMILCVILAFIVIKRRQRNGHQERILNAREDERLIIHNAAD